MTNAERILRQLDAGLDHPIRLILFGRSAIALGFTDPPESTARTLDVDVIIPLSDTGLFSNDLNFWAAQQATNAALEKEGLYITHLFQADSVFLRSEWESSIVPINKPQMLSLKLFRPATVDLILTKMMRGDDAQDLADIEFMVHHDKINLSQIEAAFAEVVLPDVTDLHDMFQRAQPHVRRIVQDAHY